METKSFLSDLGTNINGILSGLGQNVESLANYNNSQSAVAMSNATLQNEYLGALEKSQEVQKQMVMIMAGAVVLILLGVVLITR